MTLYYEPVPDRARALADALEGEPHGAGDLAELASLVRADPGAQLVILGPTVELTDAVAFATQHRLTRPSLGVVLLRDQVDVAVLAEALRSGIREVITATDVNGIRAACARSLEVSQQLAQGRMAPADTPVKEGHLITVFAGKGGCGKSTIATNLAVALADGGKSRVCLVDLDLTFGDVAIMLQLVPKRSLADAVPMAGRLDETGVRSLVTPYAPGLDTLLAPPSPAEGERVGRELVSEIVKIAKRMYDYVVVDTPPFFSDQVLAALDLSQWYILLATPDIPALKNLRLTLDMFDMLEYPTSQRIIVLNRSDAQVGLTHADIERVVRAPIAGRVPSTRDVPVSINRGVPLMVDSPNNPVSRYIREVRGWIVSAQAQNGEAPAPAPRRGVFGLRRGR
ncbi:P-loop NTPase [Planosporangium flavigriseum]|uniref:Transcriptional regulator n=1 Tax=Planosporangium flavigriseum TaxID=373681 RepID=A0A8J3LJI2_9ACTN|nr:P-loop NTPase [Planosporangium flavigriseum]NJC65214.1 P-loop NTPase [Planosporangium flavigriseum]GIG71833.1 transcriptional regulator [Planosporangium flavigriseum]